MLKSTLNWYLRSEQPLVASVRAFVRRHGKIRSIGRAVVFALQDPMMFRHEAVEKLFPALPRKSQVIVDAWNQAGGMGFEELVSLAPLIKRKSKILYVTESAAHGQIKTLADFAGSALTICGS